ncbi:MAG TPA: cytochrome c-type biogenesis protein [Usitatibacter sp.]
MRLLVAIVAFGLAGFAFGQASEVAHPDAAVEERLKGLAEELRCLVCQNQTIADSNAPLALDLRNQIRAQVAQGRSDSQIREYMVERYGDFVLYRPPFKASTAILWAGPFALLLFGAGIAIAIMRRRGRAGSVPRMDSQTRAEVASLLETQDPARRD